MYETSTRGKGIQDLEDMEEYFSTRGRTDEAVPEKSLWAAVLKDAARLSQGKGSCLTYGSPEAAVKEVDKAVVWLQSNSTAPGSFLWVCQILRVAPGLIRGKLSTNTA